MINIRKIRNEILPELNSGRNVLDQYKCFSIQELQQITKQKTFPFWVMTLNVLGDLNVSTVIRSAHLFGAEKCIIFGRRKIDNRGLVGAANYTPVEKVLAVDDNLNLQLNVFIDYMKNNKLVPIFIEHGGENCFEFSWKYHIEERILSSKHKPCLILGTEKDGIPLSFIEEGKKHLNGLIVSIPQRGVLRSHNLSMAFSSIVTCMIYQMGWW